MSISRPSLLGGLCLVLYLATVVAIVASLLEVRRRTLTWYDTPQARAQWEAWRAAVRRQEANAAAPVKRRVPESREPPQLVLMRDHFAACLSLSLVLGSALFATLALAVRGVAWRAAETHHGADPGTGGPRFRGGPR